MFTGATAPVAGMRINYVSPAGYIVAGDIDRTGQLWRVFFQRGKSNSLALKGIAVAWY
jgi:hypothetical protein